MICVPAARRTLGRPLAALLERSFPGLSPRRIAGLRWMFYDASFATASGSFYEDFFVVFALASGVAAGRIGLLVGAGGLASVLAYLPGAFFASRLRVRKPFILLSSGVVARLAILGLAFLPAVSAGGVGIAWAILVLRFTTALGGSLATPAWTTLAADLVPPNIRGRYFAARNAATGVIGAAASVLAGWTVRVGNARAGDGLSGYRLGFAIAFAVGITATACYSRIPEPPVHRSAVPVRRLREVAAILRRNPAFAWLAVSSALWSLAFNMAQPFYSVWLLAGLGGNPGIVGIGAGVTALTGLAGLLAFGRMADRRGSRRVLVITGLLLPLVPLLWTLVSAPWLSVLTYVPAGFLLAGYNLASFNLLLEMCPPRDREAGVAVYQTLVAVPTIVAPLLGSWLAGAVGYVPMFAVSGAARLAATVLFITLTRHRTAA